MMKSKQKIVSSNLEESHILRKLANGNVSSPEEYEIIIFNLEQQGFRLLHDREELRIRVELLMEKQQQLIEEQKGKSKKNPKVDFSHLKVQLERKYKDLEAWQKKCYNSVNKGALNLQVKEYLNKCAEVEAEITKFRKMLVDEKKSRKRLNKSVRVELKHLNKNVPQKELLEEENKELRRIISNLKITDDLTDHVDVRVHNSIVTLKNRNKFIDKLKTMTLEDIRREEAKDKMEIINEGLKDKEIKMRRLKTEIKVDMKTEINSYRMSEISHRPSDRSEKVKQKIITDKEAELKINDTELSGLENEKQRILIEQNNENEILLKQEQQIRKKMEIEQREFVDVSLQWTNFEDETPLPMEIIGTETLALQNDRTVLKNSRDTFINGLVVYENSFGIACIRALYSNKKFSNCLVPENYLDQKCTNKKIILNDPKDYLKWIKAYYDTTEKKLVRLEIFSLGKQKFEYGKEKEAMFRNVIPYKFDIGSNEIPVCLRVSYRREEIHWLVSSVGVEINSK